LGKREGDNDDSTFAKYFKYSYLGIQFLLSIAVPLALGIWADRKLGTKVLFTLLGLALGFGAALYSIYGELYGRRGGGGKDGGGDGRGPGGP
jgi:F0F1-type ATP synthase assembly protein I